MLLHRFAHRLPVFRVTRETLGLAVFGGVIVATVPFSVWPGGAIAIFTDVYLKMFIVFVLMMNTLTTPKRLERLTWLILLCVGYVAARGVLDYARGVNLIEGNRLAGAVGGLFGNPNDLAMNMITFLPLGVVAAMSRQNRTIWRLAALGIVVLMLATIVFTKSRAGMLGLVAMLMALILLGRHIQRGFVVMSLAAIVVGVPFMPASFWTRMASIVDERQDQQEFTGSRAARRTLLREGITAFAERPLTGVGAGQFPNYKPNGRDQPWRQTHNTLIQVASETGILGLAAFSFLIVRAAMAAVSARRMLTRAKRRRGLADPLDLVMTEEDRRLLYAHTVAMTAGLVGWFVCAMFASLAYNWTFYYVLALIVAARELTRDRLSVARAMNVKHSASVSRAHVMGPLAGLT
jgi:O-antigen ligase